MANDIEHYIENHYLGVGLYIDQRLAKNFGHCIENHYLVVGLYVDQRLAREAIS